MKQKSKIKIQSSDMRSPRLEKIVVNCGIGRLVSANPQTKDRVLKEAAKILSLITGQKPAERRARKSISGFKLREGEVVGYVSTLRGKRMYDFLARFINVALPRTRDFRGIPLSSVDRQGNLTVGIREHIVFPEAIGEDVKQLYGLEVTLVPNLRRRNEAIRLYRELGVPLQE